MNERGFLPFPLQYYSYYCENSICRISEVYIRFLYFEAAQWCLRRILYCFEVVEFYVGLTRVRTTYVLAAGGSSFLQARNELILYATFQLRIATAAKSWRWGRRHYDCIVCPSVTSEPRRRVEDGVAYTLKHIFKCIGKNGMGNIFSFNAS